VTEQVGVKKMASIKWAESSLEVSNASSLCRYIREVAKVVPTQGDGEGTLDGMKLTQNELLKLVLGPDVEPERKLQLVDLVNADKLELEEIRRLCDECVWHYPKSKFARSCQVVLWMIDYTGLSSVAQADTAESEEEGSIESEESVITKLDKNVIFEEGIRKLFPKGSDVSSRAVGDAQNDFINHMVEKTDDLAQWRDVTQRTVAIVFLCLTLLLIPVAIVCFGSGRTKGLRASSRCTSFLSRGISKDRAAQGLATEVGV
jgi:hypothetical protein